MPGFPIATTCANAPRPGLDVTALVARAIGAHIARHHLYRGDRATA